MTRHRFQSRKAYKSSPSSIYDNMDMDYDLSPKKQQSLVDRRRRNYGSDDHHTATGYGTTSHGGGHAVASLSGHGSVHSGGGYGSSDPECCPLVVDPLTLAALLGFIAAATALLQPLITMSLRRRKKRSDGTYALNNDSPVQVVMDFFHLGRIKEKIHTVRIICTDQTHFYSLWFCEI